MTPVRRILSSLIARHCLAALAGVGIVLFYGRRVVAAIRRRGPIS